MTLAQHHARKLPCGTEWDDTQIIPWQRFLSRPIFSLSPSDYHSWFAGKKVLITGAAGSIGSALALCLMEGMAGRLILLDRSEQNMGRLYRKYRDRNLTLPAIEFVLADVLRQDTLKEVFSEHRPDIVFHAAALKHVPELETAPLVALENNVLGTLRMLQAANYFHVESFVNVSTDKAVNPTSILGISKRLTELISSAPQRSCTNHASLRLGNVLGSCGSVVPRFLHALRTGQPFQITEPLASRYFVTVEETVAFLLQSSQLHVRLLLPEMGQQRRIIELLEFLQEEAGREATDTETELTGLKDGEKQAEQLIYDYERLLMTDIPQLREICGSRISDPERFANTLQRLLEAVIHGRRQAVLDYLFDLVPEFVPSPTLLRHLQ